MSAYPQQPVRKLSSTAITNLQSEYAPDVGVMRNILSFSDDQRQSCQIAFPPKA